MRALIAQDRAAFYDAEIEARERVDGLSETKPLARLVSEPMMGFAARAPAAAMQGKDVRHDDAAGSSTSVLVLSTLSYTDT